MLRTLFAAVLVAVVATPGLAAESVLPFAILGAGEQSGIHAPLQTVVRTEADWQALWRRHRATLPGALGLPPAVDFSREMVIAVFAGDAEPSTRVAIRTVVPGG